ncbi:hypothetical protein D8674_031596 [Pyrus ussuriensis x Pyrus communis]|uniref:Uncharacterized protein n=1 Tax=Pyrus ussuriensis x Pyrus communis TaxID=2448454 RepID=A0A5N5EZE5_9ROSA|nr:hypothetical protein D8674_031596 [Pyrus ussuriensis x Pyrus communis]
MADGGARLSNTMDGEDIRASFWFDVGALVRDKCVADWESWRAIPKKLKIHMIDELAAIDNMFKSRFREWKFDNQRAAKLQQEPELLAEE